RDELEKLMKEADWLRGCTWRLDATFTIEVDVDLEIHGTMYAIKLTYPYPSGEPRWRVGIRSASRPLARWGSKGLGGEDVSLFNPREAFL
ncbi:MAG TPA: hypothetical protein VGE83_01690, partial [Terracidiphilus sp.]